MSLQQIGSLKYTKNQKNQEIPLTGQDAEKEIRRFRLLLEMRLISTAVGAFATTIDDLQTLVAKYIARIKGAWNFEADALSATPAQLRSWSIDSQGADPWQEDLIAGTSVPGSAGAAIAVKIPIDVDFTHQGLDCPNMFCPSTDQMNVAGSKLLIDTGANDPTTTNVVLANGTAAVTLDAVTLQAEYGDAHGIFVGPHLTLGEYGEGKEKEKDEVPGVDLFLAQESKPADFEAVFSAVNLDRDGDFKVRGISPTALALDYRRTSLRSRDSQRFYDITKNTYGAGGTEPGSVVTPLSWVKANVRAAEMEWPYFKTKRRIDFTRVAGANAAYLFFRVKVVHHSHSKIGTVMRRLMAANDLKGAPESLAVRGFGGGDNNLLQQFKGRWLLQRPV